MILSKAKEKIFKANTTFREAITSRQKLAVCLKYFERAVNGAIVCIIPGALVPHTVRSKYLLDDRCLSVSEAKADRGR